MQSSVLFSHLNKGKRKMTEEEIANFKRRKVENFGGSLSVSIGQPAASSVTHMNTGLPFYQPTGSTVVHMNTGLPFHHVTGSAVTHMNTRLPFHPLPGPSVMHMNTGVPIHQMTGSSAIYMNTGLPAHRPTSSAITDADTGSSAIYMNTGLPAHRQTSSTITDVDTKLALHQPTGSSVTSVKNKRPFLQAAGSSIRQMKSKLPVHQSTGSVIRDTGMKNKLPVIQKNRLPVRQVISSSVRHRNNKLPLRQANGSSVRHQKDKLCVPFRQTTSSSVKRRRRRNRLRIRQVSGSSVASKNKILPVTQSAASSLMERKAGPINQPPGSSARVTKYRSTGSLSKCPICNFATKKMKKHAYVTHIPSILMGKLSEEEVDNRDIQIQRLQLLEEMAGLVLEEGNSIMDLYEFMWLTGNLSDNCVIAAEEYPSLQALCKEAGWEIPSTFELYPINSPACLAYWRVFLDATTHLNQDQMNKLKEKYPSVRDQKKKMEESLEVKKEETTESPLPADVGILPISSTLPEMKTSHPLPVLSSQSKTAAPGLSCETAITKPSKPLFPAFDSHFNMDSTEYQLRGGYFNSKPKDLIDNSPASNYPVNVVGGVMVFNQPSRFPVNFPNDDNWKYAIGVHPKHIGEMSESKYKEIEKFIQMPHVSALGDVGLDRSTHPSTWKSQETVLKRVLGYAVTSKPVVLYIKGPEGDDLGSDVDFKVFSIVRSCCSSLQTLHLIGFHGDREQRRRWSDNFPNTYFGFNATVQQFDDEQCLALQEVPAGRILIETDSPYMPPRTCLEVNTPAFMGEVAAIVASKRDGMLEGLLDCTVANGKRIYC